MATLAAPVGVVSALVAKALLWLISVVTNLAYFQRLSASSVIPSDAHLGWWAVLVPIAGALVIGVMARYGSDKIRGHGIPEAIEAILLGKSLIQPRVALLKPVSSAISIGTGGPFGAEGPIIMTGGACGSLFAQFFHLSASERKTLLVAGAAGGMTAIFATPVASVLLAVELLLFEWKPRSFIPVVVSSIVAAILRIPLLGNGPVFPVAPHEIVGAGSFGGALIIGLLVGLGSVLVTALVYGCEDVLERLPIHWMWWPACGAVIVGVGGVIDPRVLGVGYDSIHGLMMARIVGMSLLSLLVLKAIVWAVALGSGTSGGVLAPLLIMGGAMGAWLGHWLPWGDPGLWAMAGMAAMMAGMMNIPITATIFVLELSHDLNLLPVLLISAAASFAVAVLTSRRSILTAKLARRGQHVSREYEVDLLDLTRVGDVMETDIPRVTKHTTIAELSKLTLGRTAVSRHQGIIIVDDESRLAGIITRGDVMRALQRDPEGRSTVLECGCTDVLVAHPDELLSDALRLMLRYDVGRLPVVSRDQPSHVVGYLGRSSILRAHSKGVQNDEQRERRLPNRKTVRNQNVRAGNPA